MAWSGCRLTAARREVRLIRSRIAWSVSTGALILLALGTFDPPHGTSVEAPHGDAALVLSGDVDFLRVKKGVQLLTSGRVSWLVVTGAGIGGDNGNVLSKAAVALGAPPGRILVESESRTTRENIEDVAPIIRARAWTRVVLVTSASHLGRAERVAHHFLPEITWVPSMVPDAGPPSRIIWNRLHEWIKFAGYAARGWA